VLRVLKSNLRYRLLLLALLLEILLFPLAIDLGFAGGLLALLNSLILLAAIWALSDSRKMLIVGLVLGGPAIVRAWTALASGVPDQVTTGGLVFTMAFYVYASSVVLRHVIRTRRITFDTVLGALCVYFLLGYGWAAAHQLVWSGDPAAYNGVGDAAAEPLAGMKFVYFSFVTLTTLGYGDISPRSPMAQSISLLEAVTGVTYLATLVAQLVGKVSAGTREEEIEEAGGS
jgi:hypothetical protein